MPNEFLNQSLIMTIGVTFWVFVLIVVIAGILYYYAKNREIQKTIRLAIEKDIQLDAVLVDKIVRGSSSKPEDYYIGGVISAVVGVGLPILGYFIGKIAPEAFFPIAGAGIMLGLIGISLIGCGMIISRRDNTSINGKS